MPNEMKDFENVIIIKMTNELYIWIRFFGFSLTDNTSKYLSFTPRNEYSKSLTLICIPVFCWVD